MKIYVSKLTSIFNGYLKLKRFNDEVIHKSGGTSMGGGQMGLGYSLGQGNPISYTNLPDLDQNWQNCE